MDNILRYNRIPMIWKHRYLPNFRNLCSWYISTNTFQCHNELDMLHVVRWHGFNGIQSVECHTHFGGAPHGTYCQSSPCTHLLPCTSPLESTQKREGDSKCCPHRSRGYETVTSVADPALIVVPEEHEDFPLHLITHSSPDRLRLRFTIFQRGKERKKKIGICTISMFPLCSYHSIHISTCTLIPYRYQDICKCLRPYCNLQIGHGVGRNVPTTRPATLALQTPTWRAVLSLFSLKVKCTKSFNYFRTSGRVTCSGYHTDDWDFEILSFPLPSIALIWRYGIVSCSISGSCCRGHRGCRTYGPRETGRRDARIQH